MTGIDDMTFESAPVAPHLVCADAGAAMDFYTRAFGAVEQMRLAGSDGAIVHGCMTIGGAPILLMGEKPEFGVRGPRTLGGTPVRIGLLVDDVDSAFAHAIDAGARAVTEPEDQFWGDRYGVLEDPWGHQWSMSMHGSSRPRGEELLRAAVAAGV